MLRPGEGSKPVQVVSAPSGGAVPLWSACFGAGSQSQVCTEPGTGGQELWNRASQSAFWRCQLAAHRAGVQASLQ